VALTPMKYKKWLNYHGLRSTAANAKRYRAYTQQARFQTPAPAAAAPAPPPAPSPAPPAQFIKDPDWVAPVDQAQENLIQSYKESRDGTKGVYNAKRLQAADALRTQMERAGLWRDANYTTVDKEDGNKQYQFGDQKEGTAYGDAFRTASQQAGQRGFSSSSDRWDDWLNRRSGLNKQAASAREAYQSTQTELATGQNDAWKEYDRAMNSAQSAYNTWKGDRQQGVVENPAYAQFVATQNEAPPSDDAGASAINALNRQVFATLPGMKHFARYGKRVKANDFTGATGTYSLNRAGNGKWLFRWG